MIPFGRVSTQQESPSIANATLASENASISSQITIRDALSLLKALTALKLLHSGASLLRLNTYYGEENEDHPIMQAIDRREKKVLSIVVSMTPAEPQRSASAGPQRLALGLRRPALPHSPISSTVATHEGMSSLSTIHVSATPSEAELALSRPNPPGADLVAQRTRNSRSEESSGAKRMSAHYSLPPPLSDSVYSSRLRRSVSTSNVPTLSSVGRRQGMVISAAQYTRIVSERSPQYTSVFSQPVSIDSLIADGSKVDRSELEIGEGLRHSKSMESFPGKFPVSDGMEYSSLATVMNHLRVPSVRTSVRPFSDL